MRTLYEEFFFELVTTTKPHESLVAEYLKKYNLKLSDWVMISFLHNFKHLTLNEIGEMIGMEKPNVTRTTQHLVSLNIIHVEQNKQDKRKKNIHFTEKGNELHDFARKEFNEYEEKIVNGISEEEIQNTLITLKKLKKNIKSLNGGVSNG